MLDTDQPNWKRAIRERLDEIEPSMLEELSQHLEARFEELQSYDAVMSEWSAVSNLDELRAELARIRRRRGETIVAGGGSSARVAIGRRVALCVSIP